MTYVRCRVCRLRVPTSSVSSSQDDCPRCGAQLPVSAFPRFFKGPPPVSWRSDFEDEVRDRLYGHRTVSAIVEVTPHGRRS